MTVRQHFDLYNRNGQPYLICEQTQTYKLIILQHKVRPTTICNIPNCIVIICEMPQPIISFACYFANSNP